MTTTASPHALSPTGWVRDRHGIARYIKPPPPPPPEPDPVTGFKVVCYCGARENEHCVTRNGHNTKAHPQRLTARVCGDCGGKPTPNCGRCRPCQAIRDRQSNQASKAKKAAQRAEQAKARRDNAA